MRIDLHTHCGEATNSSKPTLHIVKDIVDAVKAKGLDGIAITEHFDKTYGYEVKEMVDHNLNGKIMVIPGQEIDKLFMGVERGFFHAHIVELDLPGDVTFRFIAHPGHWYVKELDSVIANGIHGIELRNPNHDDEMDEAEIKGLAEKYGLLLLTNSDAHHLSDIGKYSNEIDIDELYSRARRT